MNKHLKLWNEWADSMINSLPHHVLQQQIVELEKQRDELLFALKIIADNKTCPAVLAQLAINAVTAHEKRSCTN